MGDERRRGGGGGGGGGLAVRRESAPPARAGQRSPHPAAPAPSADATPVGARVRDIVAVIIHTRSPARLPASTPRRRGQTPPQVTPGAPAARGDCRRRRAGRRHHRARRGMEARRCQLANRNRLSDADIRDMELSRTCNCSARRVGFRRAGGRGAREKNDVGQRRPSFLGAPTPNHSPSESRFPAPFPRYKNRPAGSRKDPSDSPAPAHLVSHSSRPAGRDTSHSRGGGVTHPSISPGDPPSPRAFPLPRSPLPARSRRLRGF